MSAVISSEVLIKSDFFRYINQRMFTISCGQSLAKRWLGNSAAQHSNFKISCSKGLLAQWQTSRVGPIAQHGDIGDSWQERRLPHHLLERGRRLRWLARSAQLLAIHLNDPPDATSDTAGTPLLDEDYLILSTIHSAKGQEWRSVFILNVVDGCIPSDLSTGSVDEIEEERRLLYVAMTRAKDHLHLILPQPYETSSPRETASDLADFHQRQGHAPRFAGKGREMAPGLRRMARCEGR
jgi:UvrD-like helicase C-terminal domain